MPTRAYAFGLEKRLRERGRACFLDSRNFEAGEGLDAATRRGLRPSNVLVLVGSPEAPNRPAAQKELESFYRWRRRIVPINVGGLEDAVQATQVAGYLPEDPLCIRDELGPSRAEATIDGVMRSFTGLTPATSRRIVLGTVFRCSRRFAALTVTSLSSSSLRGGRKRARSLGATRLSPMPITARRISPSPWAIASSKKTRRWRWHSLSRAFVDERRTLIDSSSGVEPALLRHLAPSVLLAETHGGPR